MFWTGVSISARRCAVECRSRWIDCPLASGRPASPAYRLKSFSNADVHEPVTAPAGLKGKPKEYRRGRFSRPGPHPVRQGGPGIF